MFLALTPDQKFWKPGEPTILLGRWCQSARTESLSPEQYDTLAYHWDDPRKLHSDHAYLTAVYERYLELLAQRLSAIHSLDVSTRFWRIVIGGWLAYFIDTLFDRYECIRLAAESNRVHLAWTAEINLETYVPINFIDALNNFLNDSYAFTLFSEIIGHCKPFPYEAKPHHVCNLPASGPAIGILPKMRNFLAVLGRPAAGGSLGPVIFLRSGLGGLDRTKLQVALRQVPYIAPHFGPMARRSRDFKQRECLELSAGTNPFEHLLDKLAATNIPTSYVESFAELQGEAMRALPRHARTIVTSLVPGDERDSIWIAHQVERGAKLAIVQHGGGFGLMDLCRIEELQRASSDRFFTWGWEEAGDRRLLPIPADPMLRSVGKLKCQPSGRILLPANIQPRYTFSVQSAPLGPQFREYFGFVGSICRTLSESTRKLTLLRPYSADFGWQQTVRWSEACPDIAVEAKNVPFLWSANQSRLIIATHNGTVFLETLAANFPTIICLDPRFYELRSNARPYFQMLREAGIFFDDPIAAARQIDTVAANPLAWWSELHVQQARREFCQTYSCVNGNWIPAWREAIRAITRLDRENDGGSPVHLA